MDSVERNNIINALCRSGFHNLYSQGLDQDEIRIELEKYRVYLEEKTDLYLQNMMAINC